MRGIFLTKRIKKLQENGVQVDVFSFYLKEKFFYKVFKKILKLPLNSPKKPIKNDGVMYDFLPVYIGILERAFYLKKIGEITVRTFRKQLNLAEYDLVHAHWVYPHGYIASLIKKATGIPCIVSAHGSDIHTNPWKYPKTQPYVSFALSNADKVIFESKKLFETSTKLGYSGDNHIIIPNGIETDKFIPIKKESALNKLGLSDSDAKIIGFVGGLIWAKRADKLPLIFKEVAKHFKEARFIIVGDGELRSTIEEECLFFYKLNAKFIGQVNHDEIRLWMNAIDVLVLPSREEGFGSVILEAQSCGCPVVGSNAGGIPEAVGHGGTIVEDGENFEKRFANAVVSMLNKPLSGEKLRKRSLKYDWDYIIKQQVDLYEDIIIKFPLSKNM